MSEQVPDGDFRAARVRMVEHDIRTRGVHDSRVLQAMATVPRERFVPADRAPFAHENRPLPIAARQTISQPHLVALMAEAAELGPEDRVLEVGTGSGYGAAVLGSVADQVWTIERHEELADTARRVLGDLGYDNVHVIRGDGTLGHPETAPFDAIVFTAAGPRVPEALLEQLADGGRMVIPVGPDTDSQDLIRIRRDGATLTQEKLGVVRFVRLVGLQGFADYRNHPG